MSAKVCQLASLSSVIGLGYFCVNFSFKNNKNNGPLKKMSLLKVKNCCGDNLGDLWKTLGNF